ncbi:hypothetical protein D3C84_1318250 [compost metagenome]
MTHRHPRRRVGSDHQLQGAGEGTVADVGNGQPVFLDGTAREQAKIAEFDRLGFCLFGHIGLKRATQ